MDFKQVLRFLVSEFEGHNINYALIGGFTLGILGIMRTTMDIDFLINKGDAENNIINVPESDFAVLDANSAAAADNIYTPEAYIEFANQTHEIIGHRIREPRHITGTFLL